MRCLDKITLGLQPARLYLLSAYTSVGKELLQLLTSSDNTLKWCGNVSAENTFMGIPVSSSSGVFTFGLPSDQGPVGKIRLLVGSLGVSSGNDWDPTAAWLGLAMTSLIDLAIPEYNSMGGTRVVPGHGRISHEIDLVEPPLFSEQQLRRRQVHQR